jgi:hypothetical protein
MSGRPLTRRGSRPSAQETRARQSCRPPLPPCSSPLFAPSPEDIALTKRLKAAGELVGIQLLDHVIVSDAARTSQTTPTTNVTHNNPKTTSQTMTADQRHSMIQAAAYLRAEKRGFQNGNPTQDWVDAEREIDATLKGNSRPTHAGAN